MVVVAGGGGGGGGDIQAKLYIIFYEAEATRESL